MRPRVEPRQIGVFRYSGDEEATGSTDNGTTPGCFWISESLPGR